MASRALILAVLVALFGAPAASARPAPAGPPTNTSPSTPPPAPAPQASSGGLLGSPDVTQSLSGSDAACSHLTGASPQVIVNCHASGFAESPFPPANYGTDTHVDTGILDPGNDLAAIAQEVIGYVVEMFAHIVTWVILGLGLAFGFDLFGSAHGQVAGSLATAEHAFTFPLLPLAFVIGGLWGVFHWIAARNEGRAVAHWAVMLALMLAGLIIVQNPVGTLGGVSTASNGIANGALSAFTGNGGNTNNGFANATPGLYRTVMEEPWCAIEFGDVMNWCMAPPDRRMQAARRQVLQHLPDALGNQGDPQLASQQAPAERARLAAAQTNGEMFLAFLPNANARNGQNDKWTLYSALKADKPNLAAIRQAGGVGERLVTLALAGIAGVFFVILLLYIAWQLVVNSIFFVVCLLASPVVVLAPAFGHGGQSVFRKWCGWLVEALVKKILFAIYLGVVLMASRFVLTLMRSHGWLLTWLVLGGLWAMGFMYRRKFLDLLTADRYREHWRTDPRRLAVGSYLAYQAHRSGRAPQHTTVERHQHHEHLHHHDAHLHQHAHVYNAGPRYAPAEAPAQLDGGSPDYIDAPERRGLPEG